MSQTGTGQDARRNRVAEVAPDFVRLAIGFAYGEVFSRPGLDLKFRELNAISAYAALGTMPVQLRVHVAAALHLGWSRAEIVEVLIQTALHAGIPAALNALSECHDLLVEQDGYCESCDSEAPARGQV
jgi:4-carboxymuconolactone decarboxylase